jgi:peptidoglycan hydrolase-like protein with peptidoglycan-binding domain
MKRIIITETQYRRLVSQKLNEEITLTGEKISNFDIDLEGNIVRRWNDNNPEHVERIQRMLKSLEYELGPYGPNNDGVDGIYGPFTEDAVMEFQEDEMPNQPDQWDGIIGPITYEILKNKTEDKADEEGVEVDELLDKASTRDDIEPMERDYEDVEDKFIAYGDSVTKIIDHLKTDLPLNSTSNETDSIILLQKTLVDLGHSLGNYGMDKDGVDGDFGGVTASALKKEINDTKLDDGNISKFQTKLEEKKDKIKDTYSKFTDFFKRWSKQGGIPDNLITVCNNKSKYDDKDWVPKATKCYSREESAKIVDRIMGGYSKYEKAAVLSVMMKEQGKGNKICAYNNNYSGVQTDVKRWGNELDKLITGQFCTSDAERLRTFASFESPEDGTEFLKTAMENKGWFNKLNDSMSVSEASEANYKKWQSDWNLKLSDERFENFIKYGYNSYLKNKSFTDSKGIYTKPVSSLTDEEKQEHNKHISHYRTPSKISKSKDSIVALFYDAVDLFDELA